MGNHGCTTLEFPEGDTSEDEGDDEAFSSRAGEQKLLTSLAPLVHGDDSPQVPKQGLLDLVAAHRTLLTQHRALRHSTGEARRIAKDASKGISASALRCERSRAEHRAVADQLAQARQKLEARRAETADFQERLAEAGDFAASKAHEARALETESARLVAEARGLQDKSGRLQEAARAWRSGTVGSGPANPWESSVRRQLEENTNSQWKVALRARDEAADQAQFQDQLAKNSRALADDAQKHRGTYQRAVTQCGELRQDIERLERLIGEVHESQGLLQHRSTALREAWDRLLPAPDKAIGAAQRTE